MTATESRVIADKYEVLGVLGEGGTGIVYDAVRIDDRRPIALKVMHETLAGDKQIRGRFQREAAILRRLEGEHICAIVDFGEVPTGEDDRSLLYIALPKIEGESLADLLAKGPIDVDRALDIMMQVLSGLASAHAQGVIHRDLKPANVLLEGGEKAVVVDFGMSKIITGAGTGTTNLTTHNMVFGTPEYMSPEQARGDDLDARCDVYAAGVILYEMLTGSPPFTGETPLGILTAHLTSEVEPPSKRAPSRVTPALEAVVLGALARDPNERYRSATVLAAAIAHARAHPNDAGAVRPGAFSATPDANVFATTVPAAVIGELGVDAHAPTLVGEPPPLLASKPPPSRPSVRPKATPARPPTIPAVQPPASRESTRTWVLLWVVVGLVSIALGVWFALRR